MSIVRWGLGLSLFLFASVAQARPSASQSLHDEMSVEVPMTPLSTLHYFGGKVIPHAEVVIVLWGSKVSSTVTGNMPSFFQTVTGSAYLDWLGEYDTDGVSAYDGKGSSNQHVYRGSYKSSVAITPTSSSTTVQDATIQSELAAKIGSSVLPTPTIDSEGGVDTVYFVFFPAGTTVYDDQGGASCSSWCGYHGTFSMTVNNQTASVPYAVIPDMATCSCGGSTTLAEYTITSSHELAEAITDAEVGVTYGVGRPLAFYDTNYGEIGDICENTQGYTDTIGGYTVQKNWSQRLGKCIAQDSSLPLCGSQRPCRACAASDCTTSTSPICDSQDGTCRACQSDAECNGKHCDTTGACVDAPPPPPSTDGGTTPPKGDGGSGTKPTSDSGASSSSPDDDGGSGDTNNGDWNKSGGCSQSPDLPSAPPWALALPIAFAFARRRRR
jgi:MYXO-CTERM domain-containing protein